MEMLSKSYAIQNRNEWEKKGKAIVEEYITASRTDNSEENQKGPHPIADDAD